MLEIIKFKSPEKGSSLLVLGAVHGDEICGPLGIDNTIKKIKDGLLTLKRGSVTFIPICNPEAYARKKRFIDVNLNRVILKSKKPIGYEEKIAQIIAEEIDKCDYLLDIHSIPTDGPKFAFLDKNTDEIKKFVLAQDFQHIVFGWNEIYGDGDHSSGGYALENGKIAVTIECGNHSNRDCVEVAEKAILNSLVYLGIVEGKVELIPGRSKYIVMEKMFLKEKEGSMTKNYKHLDPVRAGETLAVYDDGKKIISDRDCLIIMPSNDCAKIGTEWFYLGSCLDDLPTKMKEK
ncbi:MAG: succinylglutamate desuccinylase/aspartoacylase family protein [Rickettsiales bacterium]|jgi:predicted deacylase|nr:succinylglutamate desuccinylase/aspartoacylase family protein [Rickettsiales bacterium]